MSDENLVRRVLRGDKRAGERLVTEQYPPLYRFLRHLTGSVDAAEHLTQQAFVSAWRALAGFRGGSSLATWFHRIAYREYLRHLRSCPQSAPLEAVPDAPDPTSRALDAILLHQALSRLPQAQREAVLLYHVQGLSVSEVAAVLDVPEGTVKSRLFAARERLRELLAEPQEVVRDDMPTAEPTCDAPR